LQQEPLQEGHQLNATGALAGDPATNPSLPAAAMTAQASERHDRMATARSHKGEKRWSVRADHLPAPLLRRVAIRGSGCLHERLSRWL